MSLYTGYVHLICFNVALTSVFSCFSFRWRSYLLFSFCGFGSF
jgi:hypothetical protein